LFVQNNSTVQRRITFTLHIHSLLIHAGEADVSTIPAPLLFLVFYSVLEGVDPSTRSNPCFVVGRQKIRLFSSRFSLRHSRSRSSYEFFSLLVAIAVLIYTLRWRSWVGPSIGCWLEVAVSDFCPLCQ
jgi:hypothetical protein